MGYNGLEKNMNQEKCESGSNDKLREYGSHMKNFCEGMRS